MVETERHIFLGKQLVTVPPATHIKLNAARHVPSHCFLLLPFHLFLLLCYLVHRSYPHSMAKESASNPPPTNPSIDDDVGSDSRAKNTTMMTSSFPTRSTSLMAKGEIHELTDFFKGTTVSE
jgi:hypothetical protein